MSKPWDVEMCPLADRVAFDRFPDDGGANPVEMVVRLERFRDLERRLRHAERMLESSHSDACECGFCKRISAHLAAAREEDGK